LQIIDLADVTTPKQGETLFVPADEYGAVTLP